MKDDHSHEVHGIMCGHVHSQQRPLRRVEHGPDGQWDFMCGEADHDTQEAFDAAVVVCKGCAMKGWYLPTTVERLPASHLAEFDPHKDLWTIRQMTAEEIAEYVDD